MNVLIETRFVRALLQFNKKPKLAPMTPSAKQAAKVLYIEQAGDKIRAYATNGVIGAVYTQDGFDLLAERQRMVLDRESLKHSLSMLDGIETIRLQDFAPTGIVKVSDAGMISSCIVMQYPDYPPLSIDKVFDQAKGDVDLDALNHINPDYLISLSQVGKILAGKSYGHFTPYIEARGSQIALIVRYQGCSHFKSIIAPMRVNVEFGVVRDKKADALEYMKKMIDNGMDYPDAQHRASIACDVSADDLQKAYDAESADAV